MSHIFLSDYEIKETIGKGTFSLVKLGIYKLTNEKVAIKILKKKNILRTEDKKRIEREISILRKLNHINVIKIIKIYEDDEIYYIVTEYCEKGELFNYIVSKQRLSEDEASYFYYQLINGLEHIHSNNIVHRDLKPENLLLKEGNILKIADFGLSNFNNKDNLLDTPCGSPCYASPEMVCGKKYNGFLIDVWSTGIILYAMTCGYLPFEDENNDKLFDKIMDCKLEYPKYLKEKTLNLMKKIIVPDPNKRITIKQIKEHPFYLNGKMIFKERHPEIENEIERNEHKSIISKNKSESLLSDDYFINNFINYENKAKSPKKKIKQSLIDLFSIKNKENSSNLKPLDIADCESSLKYLQIQSQKLNLCEVNKNQNDDVNNRKNKKNLESIKAILNNNFSDRIRNKKIYLVKLSDKIKSCISTNDITNNSNNNQSEKKKNFILNPINTNKKYINYNSDNDEENLSNFDKNLMRGVKFKKKYNLNFHKNKNYFMLSNNGNKSNKNYLLNENLSNNNIVKSPKQFNNLKFFQDLPDIRSTNKQIKENKKLNSPKNNELTIEHNNLYVPKILNNYPKQNLSGKNLNSEEYLIDFSKNNKTISTQRHNDKSLSGDFKNELKSGRNKDRIVKLKKINYQYKNDSISINSNII